MKKESGSGKKYFFLVIIILSLGMICGIYIYAQILAKPFITEIYPSIGEPGGIVVVSGKNFGNSRNDSRIEIDEIAPTELSYISWSDSQIEVRLPYIVDSGLLYVITENGRSNPLVYMNQERLPIASSGIASSKINPIILSLSSSGGAIGSLLSIAGLNFGANRNNSGVYFTWLSQADYSIEQGHNSQGFVRLEENDFGYELWSDHEIRVRVPDGAVSGSLFVKTEKGASDYFYFQVTDQPGSKIYKNRKTYSFSYFVSIDSISSTIPNGLYLWIPKPVVSASQREVTLVNQTLYPLIPDYKGVSVYHFKDLPSNGSAKVKCDYILQVYEIDSTIQMTKISNILNDSPVSKNYTKADSVIISESPVITEWAMKLIGKEKNPYKIAKALYDDLIKTIRYDDSIKYSIQDALTQKSGDSYAISVIYCSLLRASGIPAVPVSGYLIGNNAVRHYWVEFWINGFGWIPVDPVLGAGNKIRGMMIPFEDPARYFGDLDNKHIAFSRGIIQLSPMTPEGRLSAPEYRHSLQNIYEEASGGLSGYSSFWSELEVTGVY